MAYRWGIMGTGRIAAALAAAVAAEGSQVVAVSSASAERAHGFADTHGVARSYGDHHDLLGDDHVDVVYVATTNDRHHADTLACVQAGMPVLAEKPFALNRAQADEVIAAARASDSFLMEAMWMRVQPAFLEVERRVAAGQIGPPTAVQADFGFAATDPTGRLFTPSLGGGALLDIGIYPLTLALSLLGEATEVHALAELSSDGVDRQVAASMRHVDGVSGWVATFMADTGVEATVSGPDGSLRLHSQFHNAPHVTLRRGGDVVETIEVSGAELGYQHEVREVERCLDAGLVESPRMTWAFTLMVMRWLDEIRSQIGVVYPGE